MVKGFDQLKWITILMNYIFYNFGKFPIVMHDILECWKKSVAKGDLCLVHDKSVTATP
jgi:hypothetical protein